MAGLELLAAMTGGLVGLGALETAAHRRRLARIPTRIHINGTRGKSSVTRLVASGLRAGGVRTCAKTTGTLARMIMPDGREVPVFRPSRANVIEQIRIVAAAAAAQAEALVIECMALQPAYQWLSEARFVRATHGVITNARPDHLDVMGPGGEDVAWALCGMVPPGQRLYTAEDTHLGIFEKVCADRKTELIAVGDADHEAITEEMLSGFPYTEHRSNISLALRICADLGVDTATALEGMHTAIPDPGAMTDHTVEFFGRRITLVNGFAANDPQSTEQIWRMTLERYPEATETIAVFNCRADRPDRSIQLGGAYPSWPQADKVLLMGTGTYIFARSAVTAGLDPERLVFAEDRRVDEIFEAIVGLSGRRSIVMGMGNIGGQGLGVVRYFKNREAPASLQSEDSP